MKPDKVDRFLAKRKEREAQHATAENAQLLLRIQHPNRCPDSPGTPLEKQEISSINKKILNQIQRSHQSK